MNESPTILILAAGRGTRMHSDTPKVLHELCGRPMGLWPVRAAVDAGAGRVVVVDSPERVLEALLPDGVELVVQEHPDGTGGAVRAALAQLRPAVDASRPLVVLSGDVPLVSAAAIEQLVRRPCREPGGRHDDHHGARGPDGLRARRARRGRPRGTGRRDEVQRGRLGHRARDP